MLRAPSISPIPRASASAAMAAPPGRTPIAASGGNIPNRFAWIAAAPDAWWPAPKTGCSTASMRGRSWTRAGAAGFQVLHIEQAPRRSLPLARRHPGRRRVRFPRLRAELRESRPHRGRSQPLRCRLRSRHRRTHRAGRLGARRAGLRRWRQDLAIAQHRTAPPRRLERRLRSGQARPPLRQRARGGTLRVRRCRSDLAERRTARAAWSGA